MLDGHRHHVQQDHDHDEDVELLIGDQLKQQPLRYKLSTAVQCSFVTTMWLCVMFLLLISCLYTLVLLLIKEIQH